MAENNRPAWMSDPLVSIIPDRKLEFLGNLFTKGHGRSQKEMMALLMPLLTQAKKEGLTFTPQEMSAAIAAIKKHSSAEENSQIDKILEKSNAKPQ